MNTSSSSSEWSSGCESGWTDYFDESFESPNQHQRGVYDDGLRRCKASYEDEDEEDLSMVSDASSGPPHFHYEEEGEGEVEWFRKERFSSSSLSKEKSKRMKVKETRGKQQDLCLDDTASSPVYTSCVDSSSNQQSITHGSSAFHNEFGFWRSSNPERPGSAEPSPICGGRRRD